MSKKANHIQLGVSAYEECKKAQYSIFLSIVCNARQYDDCFCQSINQEQIKQTERLKGALASEIIEVEAAFDRFVEKESQKRIAAIQAHADEKIVEISTLIDDEKKKSKIEAELEAIYQEAIQAIEAVDIELEEVSAE